MRSAPLRFYSVFRKPPGLIITLPIRYSEEPSNSGLSIYELAKSIGWSHGKVRSSIKRLERDGLVGVEKNIRNGRSVSVVTYKKWQEFFTIEEELEEMSKLEFMDEVEAIVKSKR